MLRVWEGFASCPNSGLGYLKAPQELLGSRLCKQSLITSRRRHVTPRLAVFHPGLELESIGTLGTVGVEVE